MRSKDGRSLNGKGKQCTVDPDQTEPCHEKTCFMLYGYANNKDADQPAHPRSPISVFAVCCLDSIIPILDISKISRH